MSRFACLIITVACSLLFAGGLAQAHEVRPVYLDIQESSRDRYEVTWQVPVTNGMAPPVSPRFSPACEVRSGLPRVGGTSAVTRMSLLCPKGLAGSRIVLEGLSHTMVDGLVRLQFASGEVVTHLVRPAQPSFTVPGKSSALDVLSSYGILGFEHILTGFDHLLFVMGMVLWVRRPRNLLVSLSAFTLAHSATLSLAALGVISVPPALIESLIALSIVMLASELAREKGTIAPAGAGPAKLAFAFGLLHGLGFAGALARIGLPEHEIPMSLLGFNIGVELGQIAFVGALLALGHLARWLPHSYRTMAYRASVYVMGSVSAFWTLERVLVF